MDKFLKQSQNEGVTEEGEGQFTISLPQALQKLSSSTLPSPQDWILKLVQAAVGSGADEIVVKLLAWHTEVRFQPPGDWTAEKVLAGFADPRGKEGALDSLLIGLRALAVQAGRTFRLYFARENRMVIWDGSKAWLEEVAVHRDYFLHADFVGGAFWRSAHARKNVELSSKLAVQARCCPVPLWVDGRRFDAVMAQTPDSNHMLPLWYGEIEEKSLPALPLPSAQFRQPGHHMLRIRTLLQREFPMLVALCAERTIAYMVFEHCAQNRASECHWVRDGVVVETSRLPGPASNVYVICFASANGMKADLSGFALREDEKAERLEVIVSKLRSALGGLTYERKPLKHSPLVRAGFALAMSLCTGGAWGVLSGIEELDRGRQNRRFEKGLARLKVHWGVTEP